MMELRRSILVSSTGYVTIVDARLIKSEVDTESCLSSEAGGHSRSGRSLLSVQALEQTDMINANDEMDDVP